MGADIVNKQHAHTQEMKHRLVRLDQVTPPLLLLVLLLVCWQVVTTVWQIEPWLLPSPLQIVQAALDARGLLGPHIWQTMAETLVGFALATTVGFGLALTIDFSTTLRRAIYPILVVSQTVPIIAIAPLLVIWFGYGILPKVLVVSLVCFFPIVVSMADGLQSADPDLIALLQAMGASRGQVFWKVRLPGALPAVFSGVKIAITYSVIGAIIGEWVGASRGLGVFMLRSTNAFRTDWLFAAIAITALLSVILFLIVSGLERALLPWYHTAQREEQWEEL
jgi:ABC-type nitrate/sulfonate/bicarbonate transport system permease component